MRTETETIYSNWYVDTYRDLLAERMQTWQSWSETARRGQRAAAMPVDDEGLPIPPVPR